MREDLINEYIACRMAEGDWTEEEEALTPLQRCARFRADAERLTDEQLVSACNSYHIAAEG